LLDRDFRCCTAALIEEALAVLKQAGIEPRRITPVAPRFLPTLLRMPTPVFRVLASRMLRIDAQARSSMADDLRLGRVTEIDALCGEVCRLGVQHGRATPRNARMVELVERHRPEARPQGGEALRRALGVAA
jgi:2-dehydropantoate 2-reductase